MIQSLLSIARRMSTRELPFRKINLNVGRNTRTVEAQITVNAIGEYVIVLRDVTLASVAQDQYEESSTLVALLSPRELAVLRLVVDGETNKAVAARLEISEKTVEKHRSRIMRKTGARQAAEWIRLTYPVFSAQKSA
jgi:DNA-binding NarL/FixJ family response regulator